MKHLLYPFLHRFLKACFIVERTSYVRRKVGNVAGRKIYSVKTERTWHFEEVNVFGGLLVVSLAFEYGLNQWFGLSFLGCLETGQAMICEFTGHPPPK